MENYVGYWKGPDKEAIVLAHSGKDALRIFVVDHEKTLLTTIKSFDKWCDINHIIKISAPLKKSNTLKTSRWEPGQKAELAKRVGISKQFLCDMINRRCRAPYDTALKIEEELENMGIQSSMIDWISAKETTSPLFSQKDKP